MSVNNPKPPSLGAHLRRHKEKLNMVLPSTIRFLGILPGIGQRQTYVTGNQNNTESAEPDFLYALQPPVLSVAGVDYGFAYVLGFISGNGAGGAIQDQEVILINQVWAWTGMVDRRDGEPPEYVRITGFPNVPYVFSGWGSGIFELFSAIGYSEMAGKLAKFSYTSDTDVQYIIRMDASNGAAVANTGAASSAVVNKPSALTLRYILLEQTDDPTVRRKIPITQSSNPLYRNGGTVTLETVTGNKSFRITGRIGEKYSF